MLLMWQFVPDGKLPCRSCKILSVIIPVVEFMDVLVPRRIISKDDLWSVRRVFPHLWRPKLCALIGPQSQFLWKRTIPNQIDSLVGKIFLVKSKFRLLDNRSLFSSSNGQPDF